MTIPLVVVDDPADWPLDVPELEVVAADRYLAEPAAFGPRTRVLNLCRSLRYQQKGYYVSMLAEARGHRPIPTVSTLIEVRSQAVVRAIARELDAPIQSALTPLGADTFELSVYFGRNLAKRYDALAGSLYHAFRAPLLRASFERRDGRWEMRGIEALEINAVPEDHREFVVASLRDAVAGRGPRPKRKPTGRYDLAILRDRENESEPASNDAALERFVRAGEAVGFDVQIIGREDSGRLAEFDALFIRDTTQLNHYTHRFALKAKALGLVVMDDPDAIQRCMNKVFLAELLERHRIHTPKSMVVTKRNADAVEGTLGLPCVLKQPDGAFSLGVTKVETPEELRTSLARLLESSSLVVTQEFRPTEFDWRIGVLDGQPLYACRYYMAPRHWQILHHDGTGQAPDAGEVDTLPITAVPSDVLDVAVRAASLYGDGLFGVDLKVLDGKPAVIEVNDNPTIDAGDEDRVLGDELYLRVARHLMNKVEAKKRLRGIR